jgi:hypothetical protein
MNKTCIECNTEKQLCDFRQDRNTCKKCVNEYDKIRKKNKRLEFNTNTFKTCLLCDESKCLLDFAKLKKSFDINVCNSCYPEYLIWQKSEYHKNNYAEYYQKNKEKLIEKSSNWNKNNKDKVYESKKKYREVHKDEINFRIKENLSCRLRSLINKNGNTLVDFIDCSIEFLKKWFEFNFDDKMNWNNYGSYWHIDHVTPCAAFNFENKEDILICWNWSNLVPLEKKENASKCSKIIDSYILEIENRKKEFLVLFKEEESSETK